MPNPEASWPQISQATLADQAYALIRDRILDGDIAPGAFARELELSEAMGVSRTPIREALGRLASEGFLERIPHRGFRVPAESITRQLELYPIVSALDLLAGKLAFPLMTPADIEELRSINRQMSTAMRNGEVNRETELNSRFHQIVANKSGNQHLSELLDDLRSRLLRFELWFYSSQDHTEASIEEHTQVLDALESGKVAGALEIYERNMRLTQTTLSERRATADSKETAPGMA
jgi:DNA-binding GntR family transcriptional regulator